MILPKFYLGHDFLLKLELLQPKFMLPLRMLLSKSLGAIYLIDEVRLVVEWFVSVLS